MGNDINLRKANINDGKFLYLLRNDKDVRCNSFNNDIIEYSQHINWFEDKLKDNMCDIYILQLGDISIGQVRIDYDNDIGVISYALCKEYRGNGYSKWMLKQIQKYMKNKCCKLRAYVKKENNVSKHIFEILGFSCNIKNEYYEFNKNINYFIGDKN